ncbi:MAG TPA: MFS transporter [Oligoflexia bacterium]|nr:MFS transporter [Oligoflexia bacterium]HMR25009.1 MFS transporter [Oligoflexia bacterium]
MSKLSHLLYTQRFLPLFITQFFGAFNDNAFKNAFLIWFTYDMASKSSMDPATLVSVAAGLFILPFFLFSATAGQIADKYERSKLTQIIKLVEIVLMLACAVCFYMQSVLGLLILLFFMGLQSTFFGPIKYSLLPEHLHKNELLAGNGLIEIGTFLAILLGTLFGGLVVRTHQGLFWISVFVVLFACMGWLASRNIPKAPIGDVNLTINKNIFKATWSIMAYAKHERTVWLSVLGVSWFWFIGSVVLTQFPTYAKDVIGGNEHTVTLFLTLFSIGIGLGSAWCNKLLKGKINGKLVPYGSIGLTVAILAFVGSSFLYTVQRMHYLEHVLLYQDKILNVQEFFAVGLSSWAIVLSLLSLAICAGLYIVPLYAIMQDRTEEKYMARVIAANNVINALFMVMASVLMLVLFAMKITLLQLFLILALANIPVYFIIRGVVQRRLKHA